MLKRRWFRSRESDLFAQTVRQQKEIEHLKQAIKDVYSTKHKLLEEVGELREKQKTEYILKEICMPFCENVTIGMFESSYYTKERLEKRAREQIAYMIANDLELTTVKTDKYSSYLTTIVAVKAHIDKSNIKLNKELQDALF